MKDSGKEDLINKIEKGAFIAMYVSTVALAGISSELLYQLRPLFMNSEQDKDIDGIVDENLTKYISKRSRLEEEIRNLEKEKLELVEGKKLDEEFALEDLVVIEHVNIENHSYLYILEKEHSQGKYEEYNHNFVATYELHNDDETNLSGENFIHFTECEPLFDYLSDVEMAEVTDGKLTTSQLDNISSRINSKYKENNDTKVLTKSMDNK